jgi:hypothetical protein
MRPISDDSCNSRLDSTGLLDNGTVLVGNERHVEATLVAQLASGVVEVSDGLCNPVRAHLGGVGHVPVASALHPWSRI